MVKQFRRLAITALSVLAAAALAAPAAQAANFTTSSFPATLTAESSTGGIRWKTEAGTFECKTHMKATLSSSSTILTVNATYTECGAFGLPGSATVQTNGCEYVWHANAGSGDSYTGSTHISCPSGKVMHFTASGCGFEISTQLGRASLDFDNYTAGGALEVQATVGGIDYTVTTDDFGCPFAGKGAKTGGTYTQAVPVLMEATGGQDFHVG